MLLAALACLCLAARPALAEEGFTTSFASVLYDAYPKIVGKYRPLEALSVSLSQQDAGCDGSVGYPQLGLYELDALIAETAGADLADTCRDSAGDGAGAGMEEGAGAEDDGAEEDAEDDESGARYRTYYEMYYGAIRTSDRIIVVSGVGSLAAAGGPPYMTRGATIIWDTRENRRLTLRDMLQEPGPCALEGDMVELTDSDGETFSVFTREVLAGFHPLPDGFLACPQYSGLGGYGCAHFPVEALDAYCPLNREYWK